MVSPTDPDACPIRGGKPQHPTQFGHTALLAEDDYGLRTPDQWPSGGQDATIAAGR
jgi:IS5 family transposase